MNLVGFSKGFAGKLELSLVLPDELIGVTQSSVPWSG
jgi:hypothetical protein